MSFAVASAATALPDPMANAAAAAPRFRNLLRPGLFESMGVSFVKSTGAKIVGLPVDKSIHRRILDRKGVRLRTPYFVAEWDVLLSGSPQTAPDWKRLDGVDLLRGLAIFFVLMNHVNMRLLIAKIPYTAKIPALLVPSL